MAYDETLARRVRRLLVDLPGYVERRMFGGLGFALSGRACCGVVGKNLLVRVGRDACEEALRGARRRRIASRGRSGHGLVVVTPDECSTDHALALWLTGAVQAALVECADARAAREALRWRGSLPARPPRS